MSLKSNWQEAHKVITTGRTVRYAAEPTAWADSSGNTVNLYWTVRRVSSMEFEILALTQAAAEAGAAALQREYTRSYARWTAETDSSVSPPSVRILKTNALLCTSSITPRLVEGSIWHIEATIDEEDVIIADHEPTYDEFEELFALALARESADDGNATIVITEGHWDSAKGKVNLFWTVSNIESFSEALVVVQKKQGANWVPVTVATADIGIGGCSFNYDQNGRFRVSYNTGAVISNEYVTTDEPMPAITVATTDLTYSPYASSNTGMDELSLEIMATGSPRAFAAMTNIIRWNVNINGTNYRPHAVTALGGGLYRVRTWYYPPTAAAGMHASDLPNLVVNVVFKSADESTVSSAAAVTLTPAKYVLPQWYKYISRQPGAERVRALVDTDLARFFTLSADKVAFKVTWPYTQYTTMTVAATDVTITELGVGQYIVEGVFDRPQKGWWAYSTFTITIADETTDISKTTEGITIVGGVDDVWLTAADQEYLTFALASYNEYAKEDAVAVKYDPENSSREDGSVDIAEDHRSSDKHTIFFSPTQPNTRLAVAVPLADRGGEVVRSPWVVNSTSAGYVEILEATIGERADFPTADDSLVLIVDYQVPTGLTISSVEVLAYWEGDPTTITNAANFTAGVIQCQYSGLSLNFEVCLHFSNGTSATSAKFTATNLNS